MKFITKKLHSYLDYPVALGLMIMPFILGIGTSNSFAFQLSFATGFAALALTLFTDHQTGLVKLLPYKIHLLVDFIVGLVFIAAPFALGFSGLDAAYYWLIGATVLAVVSLHKADQSGLAAT